MNALNTCRHGPLLEVLSALDGDRQPTDAEVRAALYNALEHIIRLEAKMAALEPVGVP